MTSDDLNERLRHLHAPLPPGLVARAQLAAAAQLPPPPLPSHRRRALEGLLATALAAAIAVPLYLTHSGPTTTGAPGTQLVFLSSATMSSRTSPCTVEVQAVSGGSMHTLATIPDDPNCQVMTFGDSLLVTTGTVTAPGPFAIIDVGTGAQHSIAVRGLLGAGFPDWASPDASELAVPVGRGANGLASIDIVDVGTGSVIRQLEPRVGGAYLQLGSGALSGGAWLSDGLHLVTQCASFSSGAGCEYVVNPVTGATTPVSGPTAAATPSSLAGSPDGTKEAMAWCSVTEPYCTGGGQSVTVGAAGGPTTTVYTAPSGDFAIVVAVGNDGSALIEVSTSNPNAPATLVVAPGGRVHAVTAPAGWMLGDGYVLPGGGFAVAATQTGKPGSGQEQEVLQITDAGSSELIAGPGPASSAYLIGVAT
jgi:hypothetical protein